ncbi:hypothetical protein [Halobellus captivus]|uniref:hypothetical protein n=1 Tax=Halobellus captivus TaxID=2592614 RepID=UPI0011A29945|nr:hypothetical protein [Halobellus captivus]
MTDSKRFIATLLASLIVVSSLGGVAISPAGATNSGPAGMLALGDAQVSEDIAAGADVPIRASDLEGAIYASEHASTLEVVLTTPERADEYMGENASVLADDEIAIVLRDDEVHEGRDVAVDLDVLEAGVGFVPKVAYGTHEDGERWESAIERDGMVGTFHVPHFSTNTVSFTGGVSINASPATDGSTFEYELSDINAVSDPMINLTGNTTTENESVSGSVSIGDPFTVDVEGNADPEGHTMPDSQISVTGGTVSERIATDTQGSVTIDSSEVSFDSLGRVSGDLFVTGGSCKCDASDVTITLSVDGTQVASNSWEKVYDGQYEIGYPEYDGGVGFGFDVPDEHQDFDSATVSYSLDNPPSEDYYPQFTVNGVSTAPDNVAVSVNGLESASLGDLDDGETKTTALDLSTGSNDINITGSVGTVDYTLDYIERTVTENPTVELNGETVSHSGTLSDGETTTLSLDSSALEEGTNRINVSVGDGTLSDGSPDPSVGLEYSHEATDEQTVDYSAEAWSERYNVSHTFGDAREDPTLTIPFDGEVVNIGSVEVRRNGSSWELPKEWVHDNTTLIVGFDPVESSETLEVRATGRKVRTLNGEITVTDPTVEGDSLNSEIEIIDRSEDFAIDVSGSDRIHYTSEESWSASPHVIVDSSGGQELRLPDASEGSTTRVRTAPLNVVPESGESEVVIEDPDEPRFKIREGNTTGASNVDVTYYDTLSGERYVLWSETQDREIDADRAESPVDFTTDGNAETYTIRQMDAPGSGVGGTAPPRTQQAGAPLVLVVPAVGLSVTGLFCAGRRFGGASGIRGNALLLVGSTVVAIAAVELVAPGTLSSMFSTVVFAVGDSIAGGIGAAFAAIAVFLALWQIQARTRATIPWWVIGPAMGISAIAALEAIRPGSILGALEVVLSEYGGLVVLATIGLVGYLIYQRRQTAQAEASTPDTQVTLDLSGNSEE